MDRLQHQLSRLVRVVALLGGLTACGADGAARAAPPLVVDSIVPREAALAEFRDGVPEVRTLGGGAPTRDALVRRFVDAFARRDTAALRALHLTRAEFAWLYYPTSPQGLPPYDLSPGLMWDLSWHESAKGLRRALEEFGGAPLPYAGFTCDPRPSKQGANVVTGPCAVRLARGDTVSVRLFGLMLERGGVHKFVSYANKL